MSLIVCVSTLSANVCFSHEESVQSEHEQHQAHSRHIRGPQGNSVSVKGSLKVPAVLFLCGT